MKLRYLAALPFLSFEANAATLEFITPTGVVGPTSDIEVWVRLSAGNFDLNFDASDPDADGSYGNIDDHTVIPTEGYAPDANGGTGAFIQIDSISHPVTNTSFSCSGSFTGDNGSACSPGANYEFIFNTSGPDTFNFLSSYSLAAGNSQDFLFGTFSPLNGGANPGVYDFFTATFNISFDGTGTDDDGVEHTIYASATLGNTCGFNDPSCNFSRTVVPIPAAAWLFGSALLGLGAMKRKKASLTPHI